MFEGGDGGCRATQQRDGWGVGYYSECRDWCAGEWHTLATPADEILPATPLPPDNLDLACWRHQTSGAARAGSQSAMATVLAAALTSAAAVLLLA